MSTNKVVGETVDKIHSFKKHLPGHSWCMDLGGYRDRYSSTSHSACCGQEDTLIPVRLVMFTLQLWFCPTTRGLGRRVHSEFSLPAQKLKGRDRPSSGWEVEMYPPAEQEPSARPVTCALWESVKARQRPGSYSATQAAGLAPHPREAVGGVLAFQSPFFLLVPRLGPSVFSWVWATPLCSPTSTNPFPSNKFLFACLCPSCFLLFVINNSRGHRGKCHVFGLAEWLGLRQTSCQILHQP